MWSERKSLWRRRCWIIFWIRSSNIKIWNIVITMNRRRKRIIRKVRILWMIQRVLYSRYLLFPFNRKFKFILIRQHIHSTFAHLTRYIALNLSLSLWWRLSIHLNSGWRLWSHRMRHKFFVICFWNREYTLRKLNRCIIL